MLVPWDATEEEVGSINLSQRFPMQISKLKLLSKQGAAVYKLICI